MLTEAAFFSPQSNAFAIKTAKKKLNKNKKGATKKDKDGKKGYLS